MTDAIEVGSRWRRTENGWFDKGDECVIETADDRVHFRMTTGSRQGNRGDLPANLFLERNELVLAPPAGPPRETPAHYESDVEPLVAIRAWGLNFALGNVVKYVARAGRKGSRLDDLIKARAYLDDEIAAEKGAAK